MNNKNALQTLEQSEQSLSSMIIQFKDRMLKIACESIQKMSPEKQDQFFLKTVLNITQNEKLSKCFLSPAGKVSIYKLIEDCLTTGLELDKHAYAVPYPKKVKDIWITEAHFEIKRQGFHAMLCGGDKRIFLDLKWGVVYENEKNNIKIDRATGEITHPICIDDDRGKPVGCWVQATKLNETKIAEFYPISYIHNIRDKHSKTYKKYVADLELFNKNPQKNQKPNEPAWLTDEIPMIEKTAIKAFCRPYADVCEALSNAYYSEDYENEPEKSNIINIAENVIDAAIENLDPEIETKKDIIEEKKETPENKNQNKKEKTSLF